MARRESEVESRLKAMRERFMMLQLLDDDEPTTPAPIRSSENGDHGSSDNLSLSASADPSESSNAITPATTTVVTPLSGAQSRWKKLRKVVNWQQEQAKGKPSIRATQVANVGSPKISPRSPRKADENDKNKALEGIQLEDVELMDFFASEDIPAPVESAGLVYPNLNLMSDADQFKSEMDMENFETNSKQLSLAVSKVPEEVVQERTEAIERQAAEDRQIMLDKVRKFQEDVEDREQQTRVELRDKEADARARLDAEKQKVAVLALRKQKDLAVDFKRTREKLEEGIKRQYGAVKETFGSLLVHEETLARRFQASTKYSPQPVEFRIHLMRAVKNKLPKGKYVLMLTQYDSVGGRPLSWAHLGSNGIGNMRPGITKICPHGGRYFDRILRVEDSCFALCPPRPLIKPNFVFVLELFQLASRTNPFDKIEAYTVVPMTYESMSIIEGKIKLPLIRGEPSPAVQSFKTMERLMAKDLHNWLCNVYIEVRHMSLNELGATEEMLKSSDFDLDYFNKSIRALGIDGNPIPVLGESEGAGAGEIDPESGLPITTAGGDDQDEEEEQGDRDDVLPLPLLPVDKGIFRRKHTPQDASKTEDIEGAVADPGVVADAGEGDLEAGTAAAAGGAGAGAGGDGKTGADGEEGEDKKPLLGTTARALSFKAHPSDVSSGSGAGAGAGGGLMGMLGFGGRANSTKSTGTAASSGKAASDPNRPLLLKNDDNFLEHRRLLVQRWKDNIEQKLQSQPSFNNSFKEDEKPEEVRERGFNVQDEVFLHRQQRGKVPGVEAIPDKEARQWAAAGLEGKVVRRWQSEGPRFDSEAIAPGDGTFAVAAADHHHPHRHHALFAGPAWEELRDLREMEEYTMSVSMDPSKKKGLVPGSKAASKLRYLEQEMFGDFTHYLWGTFEFYMAVVVYLFAFWIRIYVHYLSQYLYLLSLGTPVFAFSMGPFEISYKYMSEAISVSSEVGVVCIGPIANLCMYILIVCLGSIFHRLVGFVPEVVAKFFAAYGFASILDPLLVLLIDLIYHNYNCTATSDACKEDYTSSACTCFNGDFSKLWYRMLVEEGSGLTGLFITLLLYMGTGIVGCLCLYQYLIYVHRDGRILDQWRRINGTDDEFFIPMDFEVSEVELNAVIDKGVHWRGPKGARRRLVVTEWSEMDPEAADYLGKFKKYSIWEIESHDIKSVFREFQLEPNGAIIELFESKKSYQPKSIFSTEVEKTSLEERANSSQAGEAGGSVKDGISSSSVAGAVSLLDDAADDKDDNNDNNSKRSQQSRGAGRKPGGSDDGGSVQSGGSGGGDGEQDNLMSYQYQPMEDPPPPRGGVKND